MSGETNEYNEKSTFDLDKVLIEEVGEFGKFQMKVIAQCSFAVMFMGWATNEFLFSAAKIRTRCLIPECEDIQTEFSPAWISHAIPQTGSSFDQCQRFGNNTVSMFSDTCAAELFNTSKLLPCETYLYENTNTLVYDFGLACNEWRRAMVGSVRVFGIMIALPVTGYVSDRWGRRRALALTASLAPCLGFVRYWMASYPAYVTVMFLETVLGCGSFSCCYVLFLELVGPKYRVVAGAFVNSYFAMGQMLLGVIAWAVPHWRNLTLALSLPQLICVSYFWTIKESVRWRLSKGKYKESEDLLKEMARTNGREISQNVLNSLRFSAKEELKSKEKKQNRPMLITVVFNNKRILLRCLVTSLWWVTMLLIYYGLAVNAASLTGTMHWNFVAVAAVEIPGVWTTTLLINRIGRKPLLIGGLLVCAASQAAFALMPDGLDGPSLAVYLLGKTAISLVSTTINVYTLELYPTEYRHSFYAFSSMVGRTGSILAPLTPAFAAATFEKMPFVLFGSMALFTALLTLLVPETLGCKLPDSMEEANSIGKVVH